jgi:hypothetical protein
LFFSPLENQGREIIPPTNNKCGKEVYWSENCVTLNMYGYAIIYTDSRLKQTLMTSYVDLYEALLRSRQGQIWILM